MGIKGGALALLMLLACGSCLNWQGAGNMTQDNLTVIRNMINTIQERSNFAVNVSTQLNDLWAPAWNVVVASTSDVSYDAVLYGYGFNDHWFWFNGYKITTTYISFIIWKDYNCASWYTYNKYLPDFVSSTYSSTVTSIVTNRLQSTASSMDSNDIWLTAQKIQSQFPATFSNLFNDKLAYSIVASQSKSATFSGRFCVVNYMFVTGFAQAEGVDTGSALILQMRGTK